MSASNITENYILDSILGSNRNTTFFGGTVYIALFTSNPGEAFSGTEVSGGSYARVSSTNNSTNWPDASGGSKSNGTSITFPSATGSWGAVTHWAIMDASTAGNIILYDALSTPVNPISGDTPFFDVGDLTVTCD